VPRTPRDDRPWAFPVVLRMGQGSGVRDAPLNECCKAFLAIRYNKVFSLQGGVWVREMKTNLSPRYCQRTIPNNQIHVYAVGYNHSVRQR